MSQDILTADKIAAILGGTAAYTPIKVLVDGTPVDIERVEFNGCCVLIVPTSPPKPFPVEARGNYFINTPPSEAMPSYMRPFDSYAKEAELAHDPGIPGIDSEHTKSIEDPTEVTD